MSVNNPESGGFIEKAPGEIVSPITNEELPFLATAYIQPDEFINHLNNESRWSTLLHFYFTGADYVSLPRQIDSKILDICGSENRPGESISEFYFDRKFGARETLGTLWDSETFDEIIAAEDVDQLPEDQKEFRLLWDLRVNTAKLGLAFLHTLELPKDAPKFAIDTIRRLVCEKGPHRVGTYIFGKWGKAEEEILDAFRDEKEDLPQKDSPEARQLLQIQAIKFCRNYNDLVTYYNSATENFTRDSNNFWRARLLLNITKKFSLWEQYKPISEYVYGPRG